MANESDKPITQTAKDLGINVNTLPAWISKYSRPSDQDKTVRLDPHLYDELKRWKQEGARLTEERNLLKGGRVLCQGTTGDCREAGGRSTQERLPGSTPDPAT